MKTIKFLYFTFLIINITLISIGNTVFGQTNFSITIDHVNYENFDPEMTVGLATITYTPGDEGKFMSLGAMDLTTYNFGIIVDNVYLPSNQEEDSPHSVSVSFNLDTLMPIGLGKLNTKKVVNYPDLVQIYAHLFNLPTPPSMTGPIYSPSTHVHTQDVTVTETTTDAIGAETTNTTVSTAPITPVTHIVDDGTTRRVYRTQVRNLDLDRSQHPPTATFAGDKCACVPTSSANSLKTMEEEFDNFNLPDGSSLRDVMEELSGDMNRQNEKGATREPTLKGILDYIERHNLPLEVKYQSDESDDDVNSSSGNSSATNRNDWGFGIPNPTFDFLFQMMQEKEDVTICYKWKNPDGTTSGHAVCLTGAHEFESGVKKISFKHDRTQNTAGGTTNQHEAINIDAEGAMRFGPNNKYEIFQIIAKSPTTQDEGIVNEVLGIFGLGKTLFHPLTNNDFIEVALHENIQNLVDYRITLYDGADGIVYQSITVDQFTPGATVNNRIYYFYNMPANTLLAGPAGLSLSYTGTVLPGQFISYGGSFTAVEGDATGMTSTDIGNFTQGESFALTGTGTKYSDFTWSSMSNPSPGDINPGQTYTLNTYQEITIPSNFQLYQNYPNPFNPSTTIEFSLNHDTYVNVFVYNLQGQRIKTILSGIKNKGTYTINWNGTDDLDRPISGGIYFYQIQAGNNTQTRKMILMK